MNETEPSDTTPTDPSDALFDLPLGDFTAARNALAAELRKQDDKEAAERVKALPKPTLPAWAINRAARAHPEDMAALVAANDRLQGAQEELLAGADPATLREAAGARRTALARVTEIAATELVAAGSAASPAQVDRIRATLLAAATDAELAAAVRSGRVLRDGAGQSTDAAWGFTGAAELEVAVPPRSRSAARAAAKRAKTLAGRAEQAEALARDLAQEARRAEEAADVARSAASEARLAALAARREADEAAREL